MSSIRVQNALDVDGLQQWVARQQRAVKRDMEVLDDADAAEAAATMLVGAAFAFAGWLLLRDATAVSGPVVVGYPAAGRAATAFVAVWALRYGVPEFIAGFRTLRYLREQPDDGGEA